MGAIDVTESIIQAVRPALPAVAQGFGAGAAEVAGSGLSKGTLALLRAVYRRRKRLDEVVLREELEGDGDLRHDLASSLNLVGEVRTTNWHVGHITVAGDMFQGDKIQGDKNEYRR